MRFSILRFSVSTGEPGADTAISTNNRWSHTVDPQLQVCLDGSNLRVEAGRKLLMQTDLQQHEWHIYHKNQSLLFFPAKADRRVQLKFRFMGDLQRVIQHLTAEKLRYNIHLHSISSESQGGSQHSSNSPQFINSQQPFANTISTPQFRMQPAPSQPLVQAPVRLQSHSEHQQQTYKKVYPGNMQSLIDVTTQFTQQEHQTESFSPPAVSLNADGDTKESIMIQQIRTILADPEFPTYLRQVHSMLSQ